MAPRVLITDLDQGSAEHERRVFDEQGIELEIAQCRNEDDVVRAAGDADALLVQYCPVGARAMDALPRVKVIARYGVGYDMLDVPAATERGVLVITVPDFCTEEVADHALTLLLACARRLPRAMRQVAAGGWNAVEALRGTGRLADQTLGIVGLGRIGSAVARRAQGFGMRLLAHDPYLDDVAVRVRGAQSRTLQGLLAESDYVSLHAPLSATTRHMIGADQLAAMQPTAYLINTSRGGLVDQEALLVALQQGRPAGAALDVLEREPIPPGSPLLRREDVILTPHAAFYSDASLARLKHDVATQIATALRGELPRTPLNPDAWAVRRRSA
jgi:D-3-phosphoglycerate dehydrogenase